MSHDHGRVCPCVRRHRPKPLELNGHHIIPLSEGGPDTDENIIYICPTAHVNVHEVRRALLAGRPHARVSRFIRKLAGAGIDAPSPASSH